MKWYRYRLVLPTGENRTGRLQASSLEEARRLTRLQSGMLLSVSADHWGELRNFFVRGGFNVRLFIKQLALLIGASLPLKESLLSTLQHCHKGQKQVIEAIYQQVCQGMTLADALSLHPRLFRPMCQAVVAAGERGGNLGYALSLYAEYLEKQHRLVKALRQALSYPLLLLFISVIVIVTLLTVAVPDIVSQLSLSNVALPTSTRIVLALGNGGRQYGIILLLLLVAIVSGVVFALREPKRRKRYHRYLLQLPLIGGTLKQVQTVRLLMTFSILTRTAVPVVEALRLTADAVENLWLRDEVHQVATLVAQGTALTQAFSQQKLLDDETLSLIAAGEQSGRVGEMLSYVSDLQSKQLEDNMALVVKAAEPVLIFLIGFVVLLVFMAIIQPMLSLNNLSLA